jgi:hypothetical protein
MAVLEWCHPDDRFDSGVWNTRCVFARNDNTIITTVNIRVSSEKFILRPTNYRLGRPKIVKNILHRFDCYISDQQVPLKPILIRDETVVPFVNNVLISKERALPVILLSPILTSGLPMVEPDDLADKLLGFAIVACMVKKPTAFALTDYVGKAFSCFDGAVRLYWPGFSLSDSPFVHPLYLRTSIEDHLRNGKYLEDYFFNILSEISAYRTSEIGQILFIKRKLELQDNSAIDALHKKIKDRTMDYDNVLEHFEIQLKRNKDQDEAILNHEIEIERLNELVHQQKANCSECRRASYERNLNDQIMPDDPETSKPTISSVHDALEFAKQNFESNLEFLSTAIESAKDSPFKKPEDVYNLFIKLNELQNKQKQEGKIGESYKTALAQAGFDYKPTISETSKGKYKSDYTFIYNSKKELFDEHVTIGIGQNPQECISIHWIRDDSSNKIIIGYCGKHLTNTKT